jgi:hypothetical protein
MLIVLVQAQSADAKKYVDSLCGCFNVEFKYAETFSPDEEYKFHKREGLNGGTELTFPVEVSDNKIVMQHLLVISEGMIVKHWREDWTYENPEIWKFKGNNVWEKERLPESEVKGKWTQSVWEVSDAPRYQGAAEWVTLDGKTFWQNTTDAPLPRREYSIRNDYNILKRTNRLVLNDKGYVHEQDNEKIIRKGGVDKLLVEEKGKNTYVRVDDKDCDAGRAYWEKTKPYWTKVRQAWEQYLAGHNTVTLKSSVDDKVLHEHLFALAKEYSSGKLNDKNVEASVKSILEKFWIENGAPVAASK